MSVIIGVDFRGGYAIRKTLVTQGVCCEGRLERPWDRGCIRAMLCGDRGWWV